jgi:N-formylglutamate deformylase
MQTKQAPVVFHIPHSSLFIPKEVLGQFCISEDDLEAEKLLMTDWYTNELFDFSHVIGQSLEFPVSRLVVDPERFENDDAEVMSKVGMGVIYTRRANGAQLRRKIEAAEREKLIELYYRPHHKKFSKLVKTALLESGNCLVLDCHSFPDQSLPYELDQSVGRPDICIGTDSFHTPKSLSDGLTKAFSQSGFSVKVNSPFSGAIVPMEFYGRENRVSSVMVEINRKLYMDESTGKKRPDFNLVLKRIQKGILSVIEGYAS